MQKTLGEATWRLPSEDYDGLSDDSRVTVFEKDGKCWLELRCNDAERRLQVYPPEPGSLVVDESRLETEYPICADTDQDVALVAERLGLRIVS